MIGVFGRVVSVTSRTFTERTRVSPTSNLSSMTAAGGFTVIATVFLNTRPEVSLRTV